jgi:hypothetical protein
MPDIISKRQAKAAQDTVFLEPIDSWEIVEIQSAALISKEHSTKPVCRHQLHDEPDEDPIMLQKVLRTHGYPELRGYSGLEISDEQLAEMAVDDEPVAQVPPDVFRVEQTSPKGTDAELVLEEEHEQEQKEEDVADIGSSPAPSPQATATERETESESGDEDEEEEEQEQNELEFERLRNRLEEI